jgi:hypothetical protein
MDSSPIDDAQFTPISVFPVDELLQNPLAAQAQPIPLVAGTGQPIPVQGGGGLFSGLGSALGDVLGGIPGIGSITQLLRAVVAIVGDVESGIKSAENAHPLNIVTNVLTYAENATNVFIKDGEKLWPWMDKMAFGKLFDSMLHDGLGLDTSKFTGEEKDAVKTVDTMLGFTAALMFTLSAIDTAGKFITAGRWPTAFTEVLSKIPEEIGLSWALGLTINESFKAAQGVVLQEAINKQMHPNRLAWPQARVLLKQHVLTQKQFDDILDAAGYDKNAKDQLNQLIDIPIPVGDIAQLWYRDEVDDTTAKTMLNHLGFDDHQTDLLFNLYMAKSDNQSTALFRVIGKQMFAAQIITEGQYREILTAGHFPSKLIKDDIAAIQFEQKMGRVLQSVSVIKQRFQHHTIDSSEATKELHELNYTTSYIGELLEAWTLKPLVKSHGLSQAKILSYYISGVISRSVAEPQLLATGLDQASTTFLLDHPSSNASAHHHEATPGLVTQAYVDGAIQPGELQAAYTAVGVTDAAMSKYVAVAQYKLAHKRGSPNANIPLSEADYKAAYKVGLIDFNGLVSGLETIGYNPDNALLIAEITNKGPLQKAGTPAFTSILDAIEYMTSHGYKVSGPPDPLLLAAEGMLAAAGYTWIALAPSTTPPPLPRPGPGPVTG